MNISRIKYWVPAVLWACFIFYLSSRQNMNMPSFPYSDKIAHICIYIVLGYLIMMALRRAHQVSGRRGLAIAILIAALYGFLDEIHQYFVPTRTAELFDLISDAVGGALGTFAYSMRQ